MICEKYCCCSSCVNNDNCPLEHYGDGSPFCGEFNCNVMDCNRNECITYEDLLEVYN
jgi:hypothetical protein